MEENHFHYTNLDDASDPNSPPSDRLVICAENDRTSSEMNLQGTNVPPKQSPVIHSHQDNGFSMASLLRQTEQSVQVPYSDVNDESSLNELSCLTLPSIHDAFLMYSETALADTLDRMLDYVQPPHMTLPHSNAPTVQPVVISTTNTATTKPTKQGPREKPKKLEKPPYPYAGLIIMAIHYSPNKKMTITEIRSKLAEWFPFFRGAYTGWKDSVRHCLTDNKCFYKTKPEPSSRCHFWLINYQEIRPCHLVRQHRKLIDVAKFKYYLHEQLGLSPFKMPSDKQFEELILPAKPASDSASTASVCTDLLGTRTDDAMSECNDQTAQNDTMTLPTNQNTEQPRVHQQQQKRKSELSDDIQLENPKSRKMAAVNPTLSTTTPSCTVPEPTKVPQTTYFPTYPDLLKTVEPQTSLKTNNNIPYQISHHLSGNQPDLFPGGHFLTPYSTYFPQVSTYGHQPPYQRPYYNTETGLNSMYSTSSFYSSYHGHQNYDVQLPLGVPATSWYNSGHMNNDSYYNWYSQRQNEDPFSMPVNLCKTSDNSS